MCHTAGSELPGQEGGPWTRPRERRLAQDRHPFLGQPWGTDHLPWCLCWQEHPPTSGALEGEKRGARRGQEGGSMRGMLTSLKSKIHKTPAVPTATSLTCASHGWEPRHTAHPGRGVQAAPAGPWTDWLLLKALSQQRGKHPPRASPHWPQHFCPHVQHTLPRTMRLSTALLIPLQAGTGGTLAPSMQTPHPPLPCSPVSH